MSKSSKKYLQDARERESFDPTHQNAAKLLHDALYSRWRKALCPPGFVQTLLRSLKRVEEGAFDETASRGVLEDASKYLLMLADSKLALKRGEKVPDQLNLQEKRAIELAEIVQSHPHNPKAA